MNKIALSAAGGALGVLALVLLVAIVAVYTGSYNVAATEGHRSFTRWALDTTMRTSVARGASALDASAEPGDDAIASAAREYAQTCEHCHAGPGVERSEWASGMRPQPPHLTEAATEWTREEVFWLVRHGVRMTGMPAFGPSHDEETLWAIATFVKDLPGMTPEDYRAQTSDTGEMPEPAEAPAAQ